MYLVLWISQALHNDSISVGTYGCKMAIKLSSGSQSRVPWMVSMGWPQYKTRAKRLDERPSVSLFAWSE